MEPAFVARHFVPLGLDTYFRGDSEAMEFCKAVGAGGNHVVVATAGGRKLGDRRHLKLRERELAPVLEEFRALPEEDRKPRLAEAAGVIPPKRPVPPPPENGLILRGFCSYARLDAGGKASRPKVYYYEQNPDRWPVEAQSDLLWLTEREWRSFVPEDPKPGDRLEVVPAIRNRFYSSIGIDYMEGSVNSLPARRTSMTLAVESATPERIALRLDGYGRMGKEQDDRSATEPSTRGCEVRVLGFLEYDRKRGEFVRFDLAGLGRAWGSKMNYVRREMKVGEQPWNYAIAVELVRTRDPMDLIPPYNMLHYGGAGGPYFAKE